MIPADDVFVCTCPLWGSLGGYADGSMAVAAGNKESCAPGVLARRVLVDPQCEPIRRPPGERPHFDVVPDSLRFGPHARRRLSGAGRTDAPSSAPYRTVARSRDGRLSPRAAPPRRTRSRGHCGRMTCSATRRTTVPLRAVHRGVLAAVRAAGPGHGSLWPGGGVRPVERAAAPAVCQGSRADGDPERAARLDGAADGLRRRVGLPAWPHLRRVEADLVARLRQRLGDSQFDQAFSAGSRLTQQEAVATVRNQNGTGAQAP